MDLDVSKFFDSVRWDLALKAVGRHTDQTWILLYADDAVIHYCKDGKRLRDHPVTSFAFCGYTDFLPAPSSEKITEMGRKVSSWKISRRTTLTLEDIARRANPVLRGWFIDFTVLSEQGDPAVQAY